MIRWPSLSLVPRDPVKTDDLHWYHLFGRRGTRRDFLRVAGGAAALVAMGATPARRGDRRVRFRVDPFDHGVASGDPVPRGVVLWTRLSGPAVEGAGASGRAVPVAWEIAADRGFRRIVGSGEAEARPELGHSVHVEAEGLEPGRVYHYRFRSGGAESPVGRTRTAAEGRADTLRFAFASCQHYQHGYWTAYRHMADEDLDLVVHLGDYIYESSWGDNLVRAHEADEPFDLADYRARYALYRSDPDLQRAHAAFPWVVTWDDHEVDNNYADGVPEDGQHPEAFLLRRAAAYQAYYEFMPLRRSSMPRGPDMRLYRRLAFGDLVQMDVLDTRQYRSDQACGDGNRPRCAEHLDPARTMMGADQERWLLGGLGEGGARWNVVANQLLVADLRREGARGETTFSMDQWAGYPRARRRLLEAFASGRVRNPVVLTGDIHSNWVADLKLDFSDPSSPVVGTELVGTSISSGGDGRETFPGLDDLRARNPHIRFYNGRRGYVRCDVRRDRLEAYYRVVPWITQPGAPLETRATWVVEDGRPGAQRG